MLKIQIEQFERGITFQVHNQTADITRALEVGGPFRASNGWKVAVAEAPELDVKAKTVYLQGRNGEKNLRVDRTWDLISNYNRDKYIIEANEALQELVSAIKYRSKWTAVTPCAYGSTTVPQIRVCYFTY